MHSPKEVYVQYFLDPDSVKIASEAAQERVERIRQVRKIILDPKVGPAEDRAVPEIKKKLNVSEATAKRIYDFTMQLNSEMPRAHRHTHIEFFMSRLMDLIQRARSSGELQEERLALKLYLDSIRELYPEGDVPDADDLRLPDMLFENNPELLGVDVDENFEDEAQELLDQVTKSIRHYV